jgi:hypothetical protein
MSACQLGVDDRFERTRLGEIALHRDVSRTATVRATAPSIVLALAREPFVAAVSGREAAAAAEEVIRGRIGC